MSRDLYRLGLVWGLACFAAALALTTPTAGAQGAAPQSVAVIPKGTTHDFWKAVHAGARKAEQELGGLQVIWQGPLREDDRNSQIQVVQSHAAKGTKAIVLAPLDARALRNPVIAANKRKIPVVIIDSDIERDGLEIVSFVATDNYKGGQMAAQELARLMGDKGNLIMMRYMVGSASTEAREKGFLEEMKKHPGIKILSDNQYAGATQETALQKGSSLLLGIKEPIDGVFCPNESSTLGMWLALRNRALAGKAKFVGFDASDKLLDGLKAGEINALIVQNPFKMGYEGVKAAHAALAGQKVEPRIDTGAVLLTKENLETPEIAEVIHPPLDKYLK